MSDPRAVGLCNHVLRMRDECGFPADWSAIMALPLPAETQADERTFGIWLAETIETLAMVSA